MRSRKISYIKLRMYVPHHVMHDSHLKTKPYIAGIGTMNGYFVRNKAVMMPMRNVKYTDNMQTVSVQVHGLKIGMSHERKVHLWE